MKMKMKKCINGYFICLLMAIICFVLVDNFKLRYCQPTVNNIDTVYNERIDTLWKDTTITKTELKPVYIEKIRVDTFQLNGKDTILITETKHFKDTLKCGEDSIILENYISGINSKLDSTKVQLKKSDIIITKEVEITKYIEKPKKLLDHFKIAPTVTAGYDVVNKQFGVMAGVGIAYVF